MNEIDWDKFMFKLRKNLTPNSPIYVKGCIKFYDLYNNSLKIIKEKVWV